MDKVQPGFLSYHVSAVLRITDTVTNTLTVIRRHYDVFWFLPVTHMKLEIVVKAGGIKCEWNLCGTIFPGVGIVKTAHRCENITLA